MCYKCLDSYGPNVLECNSDEVTKCGIARRILSASNADDPNSLAGSNHLLASTIFYKNKVDVGGGFWKYISCDSCLAIVGYAVNDSATDGTCSI